MIELIFFTALLLSAISIVLVSNFSRDHDEDDNQG